MTYNRERDSVVWQWGDVLQKFDRKGREGGLLGMPTSGIWGPGSYRGATYDSGRIVWSKDTGAHIVLGRFDDAYERAGGVKGRLALPTADRERSKSLPDKGRRQVFQGGKLYMNPHKDGAFIVWGALARRYVKLGEAGSACGYPVADMTKTEDGLELKLEHGSMTYAKNVVKVACP
jgi:uncharacterized protein with LGFP repeats